MTSICDWAMGSPAHGFHRLTNYRRPPAVDLRLGMRHARVMTRRPAVEVPADLRARLEAARLDLLALFRALDRMDLAPSELAALEQLPVAATRFRKNLPPRAHPRLAQMEVTVRQSLLPAEAYSMVPGRDPQNG